MAVRTRLRTVTFRRPFMLGHESRPLPAGTYRVETDEELLEGLSFVAYRRVSTLIYLQADTGRPGVSEVMTVEPDDLEAALARDGSDNELG